MEYYVKPLNLNLNAEHLAFSISVPLYISSINELGILVLYKRLFKYLY